MFRDVLLTVDFDRTLTGPDSRIPQRNLDAIHYFIEHGGSFTINTGRSVNTMGPLLELLPVNAPFLLYNGSAAYWQGALFNCRTIDLDLWQTMAQVHRQFPTMNLEIQGADVHYLYDCNPGYEAFYDTLGWKHLPAVPGMDVGPFLKFSLFGTVHEHTVSHFFTGYEEEVAFMDHVEQWLKDTYGQTVSIFRAAPRIIDVHAAGVSKGVAARTLQKQLEKKILVCVGDAENDIAMLDDADFAYCPADGILANRYENVCECAKGAVADVIYEKIPGILNIQP